MFDYPPEKEEKTISLEWDEGDDDWQFSAKREIVVRQQTQNKKIYFSDKLYAEKPTRKVEPTKVAPKKVNNIKVEP